MINLAIVSSCTVDNMVIGDNFSKRLDLTPMSGAPVDGADCSFSKAFGFQLLNVDYIL